MTIEKCDYCGAEIISDHYDSEKKHNSAANGWCRIEGSKFGNRWTKDICPNCVKRLEQWTLTN